MQAQPTLPQTLNVRVLRPFYFGGKPTKVNETIELPRIFAQEMKAAQKVEILAAKPEPAPRMEKPEGRKGDSNAR